jgi:hypothetical protein
MRFSNAIELAGHRRTRRALECSVPLTHEPLANSNNLALAQADFRGDLVVWMAPAGLAVVREEQDLSPPENPGRHRLPTADRFKVFSLIGCKTHTHLV